MYKLSTSMRNTEVVTRQEVLCTPTTPAVVLGRKIPNKGSLGRGVRPLQSK